jgi:hypothetical protein
MSKILNRYSGNTGNFIIATGVLHLVTGFVLNWGTAIDMFRSGIVNTADATPERFGFFWFQISGLFAILTGSFLQQYMDEYKKPVPKKFGYYLLIIAIIGCVMEPVSGFYVYLPISLLMSFSGNDNFITVNANRSNEFSH